jgi:hypothetical protein
VLELTPVASVEEVLAAQRAASDVHASEAVCRSVALSPRPADPAPSCQPWGGLMLLRAAMARAPSTRRATPCPTMFGARYAVTAHRLLMAPGAGEGARRAVIADAWSLPLRRSQCGGLPLPSPGPVRAFYRATPCSGAGTWPCRASRGGCVSSACAEPPRRRGRAADAR